VLKNAQLKINLSRVATYLTLRLVRFGQRIANAINASSVSSSQSLQKVM